MNPESQNVYVKDKQDENDVSLQELWGIITSGKRMISAVIAIFFILNICMIFLLDSKYTAYVTLFPSTNEQPGSNVSSLAKNFGGIADLAGINLGGAEGIEKNISTFNSRIVIGGFIKENNLLPKLFYQDWDVASSHWKKADGLHHYYLKLRHLMSGREGKFSPYLKPSIQKGIQEFSRRVVLLDNKKTGIVTLSVVWDSPDSAALIANDFVTYGNKYILEKTIELSERKQRFLHNQLGGNKTKEVQNLIYNLIEKELAVQMYANVREDYAFHVIDPAQIPEVRTSPRVGLMLGMSLFLGLICGVLLVLMKYFFIVNNGNQSNE